VSPPAPSLPLSVRSVFRVSHPLDGLLLTRPADCISSRKRSWGCPLQSFFLATKPWRLSTPAALMTFTRPPYAAVAWTARRCGPRPLDMRFAHDLDSCGKEARLQGLSPRRSSLPTAWVFATHPARCSPGVLASSGFRAARSWGLAFDAGPPPVSLTCTRLPVGRWINGLTAQSALRSVARSGCGLLALAGSQPS
jgi:hypothetical protein